MSKLLTGSINLSKIDKNKLFTSKNGEKYLNISINDEKDKYGNIAGIQQQTKKDETKIYIGNLKEFEKQNTLPEANTNKDTQQDDSDNLPF